IIMAAMAQNNIPYHREEPQDSDGSDDEETGFMPVAPTPQPDYGTGSQPVIEGTPAEVIYGEEAHESRSQPREAREQRDPRRQVRGRRPQRERFNAGESVEQPTVDVQENVSDSPTVKVEAEVPSAVVEEATPATQQ